MIDGEIVVSNYTRVYQYISSLKDSTLEWQSGDIENF